MCKLSKGLGLIKTDLQMFEILTEVTICFGKFIEIYWTGQQSYSSRCNNKDLIEPSLHDPGPISMKNLNLSKFCNIT